MEPRDAEPRELPARSMPELREPLNELVRCGAGVERFVVEGRVAPARLFGRVDAALPALGVRPVEGRVEAELRSP